MRGKVYLVGAGPGDPELITVRGLKVLRQASIVLYDRLVHPQLLQEAPADAKRLYVGKEENLHCVPQGQINHLLVAYAQHGECIVRLKGGDPFVFGRGGEEAEALAAAGVPFEIVPGVSSAVAAPAYAGIPVTHRRYASSFAVITGHEENGRETTYDWTKLATAVDTLVVLMGLKTLPQIVSQLLSHGRTPETPVALIRWGTRNAQETLVGTLQDIVEKAAHRRFSSPVVTIIGEVVNLRDQLRWFDEVLLPQTPLTESLTPLESLRPE
jgi:uroporphyrin-III C-methyltransferase